MAIDKVMRRYPAASKAYYEEVHQHLAPLARELEMENENLRFLLRRRMEMDMEQKKHYAIESFPDDFAGHQMHEVDLVSWLNQMLIHGKTFCGYIPDPNGMILNAIFLVEET